MVSLKPAGCPWKVCQRQARAANTPCPLPEVTPVGCLSSNPVAVLPKAVPDLQPGMTVLRKPNPRLTGPSLINTPATGASALPKNSSPCSSSRSASQSHWQRGEQDFPETLCSQAVRARKHGTNKDLVPNPDGHQKDASRDAVWDECGSHVSLLLFLSSSLHSLSSLRPLAGLAWVEQYICPRVKAWTFLVCRAYKLGRRRWSYNKVDFKMSSRNDAWEVELEEGTAVKNNPLEVPVSIACKGC